MTYEVALPDIVRRGLCRGRRFMMSAWRSNQPQRPRGVSPKLRDFVLARAQGRCQIAGPQCAGTATTADHIIPWFEGGTDDPMNMQAACDPCHAPKTQAEAQRARAKFSRKRPPARHPAEALRARFSGEGMGNPSHPDRSARTA